MRFLRLNTSSNKHELHKMYKMVNCFFPGITVFWIAAPFLLHFFCGLSCEHENVVSPRIPELRLISPAATLGPSVRPRRNEVENMVQGRALARPWLRGSRPRRVFRSSHVRGRAESMEAHQVADGDTRIASQQRAPP